MSKYFRVWLLLSFASFQSFFVSRIGAFLFLVGKILRFIFFALFLIFLVSKTKVLAGYNLWQVMLFYLTFNFIDSTTQMLFREVYRFRQQIISGSFDLVLVKPVNSLFRSLFGWTDILDFITLIPFIIMIIFVISKIPEITSLGIVFYIILVANALLIATSFHIIVLALAILTTEIDHAIMIYRDLTGMGKIPVGIYSEPLRSFITFVVPVGIMMSYPVESLLGKLGMGAVSVAFFISLFIFSLSMILWNYAVKSYTSASS